MIKVEITETNNENLARDAAENNLSKKDLVNMIIAAYYGDLDKRNTLFGFDLLNSKLFKE